MLLEALLWIAHALGNQFAKVLHNLEAHLLEFLEMPLAALDLELFERAQGC